MEKKIYNSNISKEINKEVNEKGKTPYWNFIIIKAIDTSEINREQFKEIENETKSIILNNNGLVNFGLLVKKKSIKYMNILMDLIYLINMELEYYY